MKIFIPILFFLFQIVIVQAQNNCTKYPLKPINIIPNPSFETSDTIPCPSGYLNPRLSVLPNWFKPTYYMNVGFFNSCSNFSIPDSIIAKFIDATYTYNNPNLNSSGIFAYSYTSSLFPIVPQPVPDGNSVVGINDLALDGKSKYALSYKSYIATCLQQPLLKDSLYTLSFYVGFGKRKHYNFLVGFYSGNGNTSTSAFYINDISPPYSPSTEKLALFGFTDCSALPVKPVNASTCLSTIGWSELGSTVVSGDTGTWVKTSIQFKPSQNISVIALGPSCDTMQLQPTDTITWHGLPDGGNYSYFLDNLQLYQSTVAMPFIHIASGSVCTKAVNLLLQSTDASLATASFQWYKNGTALNGENKNNLSVTANNYGEGYYQCRAQSDSFCLLSDSFKVAWPTIPNANILGKDTVACIGDSIVLNAYTDAVSTYQWQDGSANATYTATKSGLYKVNITNSCGTAQSSRQITFQKCSDDIYVPTAFTPNGDGLNDVFRVKYFQAPISFNMKVYNRFGQVIFETRDPSKGWDGSLHDFNQPIGTYIWVIDYVSHNNVHNLKKGTVTLIR
jgi:gliding motility-associated-like protein